jgi:hypothetical protein
MDIRTFEYLKPTDDQLQKMETLRHAFYDLACTIEALVPEGPDRTFALRELRTCGMWCNISVTRNPDGSPRL